MKAKLRYGALAAVLVLAGFVVKTFIFPSTRVCGDYPSPNGKYHLVAYCYEFPHVFASGPGDAQAGSGFVRLYDKAGKAYGEAKLSTMLAVASPTDIIWNDGDVSCMGGDTNFDIKMPRE